MVQIGIDTRPEPFEPSPTHPTTYGETRREAWRIVQTPPVSGEEAIACALLALAAQVARLADVAEYQAQTGGRA